MNKFDEEKFLDALFEIDDVNAIQHDATPSDLPKKLYDIAESSPTTRTHSAFHVWRIPFTAAASVILAAVVFFITDARQQDKELEQARQELIVALQYLNQTHRSIEPHLTGSLRNGLQMSTIEPVLKSTKAVQL